MKKTVIMKVQLEMDFSSWPDQVQDFGTWDTSHLDFSVQLCPWLELERKTQPNFMYSQLVTIRSLLPSSLVWILCWRESWVKFMSEGVPSTALILQCRNVQLCDIIMWHYFSNFSQFLLLLDKMPFSELAELHLPLKTCSPLLLYYT